MLWYVFFFNDTATTEIYTLSLHDALPIFRTGSRADHTAAVRGEAESAAERELVGTLASLVRDGSVAGAARAGVPQLARDRKSTRLNSSHANISYAVFCLKKK